jgi:hypothetical protein
VDNYEETLAPLSLSCGSMADADPHNGPDLATDWFTSAVA